MELPDDIVKLAILQAVITLLSEMDLSICDGMETNLELTNGDEWTVRVHREPHGEDDDT